MEAPYLMDAASRGRAMVVEVVVPYDDDVDDDCEMAGSRAAGGGGGGGGGSASRGPWKAAAGPDGGGARRPKAPACRFAAASRISRQIGLWKSEVGSEMTPSASVYSLKSCNDSVVLEVGFKISFGIRIKHNYKDRV